MKAKSNKAEINDEKNQYRVNLFGLLLKVNNPIKPKVIIIPAKRIIRFGFKEDCLTASVIMIVSFILYYNIHSLKTLSLSCEVKYQG